jgi:dienelactone hydrolase
MGRYGCPHFLRGVFDQEPKSLLAQPAVIVAHTAIGPQDAFIQVRLMELAKEGYIAFALDLFGAEHCVFGDEKNEYNAELKNNRQLIAERALAALSALQRVPVVDSARIGALGYCLGGKCVLDLARAGADLRCVVSFHGILDGYINNPGPIQPRLLVFHGYSDPFTTPDMLTAFFKEMEDRNANYEVDVFGSDVLHAFTRPEKSLQSDRENGLQYNEEISDRCWSRTIKFLSEGLG